MSQDVQLDIRINADGSQAVRESARAAGAVNQIGASAAQTAAALRGVPAQFTDIVTSLQGGQSALTVFLQQGGQLRDMFGGAGAAAQGLGGYVLSLINPISLLTTAAAGLAVAWEQGSAESATYAKTLILTGNAAGSSVNQLKSLAAEAAAGANATKGAVAAAINAMAASGKVATDVMVNATQAALRFEAAGGPAVAATVDQFIALGDSPVKASLKLNESTNFLTESVYQQIKALEEQGRASDAAKVAQNAWADEASARSIELTRNLGTLETAWKGITGVAAKAWDAMLNVGRDLSPEEQIDRQLIQANIRLEHARKLAASSAAYTDYDKDGKAYTVDSKKDVAALEAQKARLLAEKQATRARVDAAAAEKDAANAKFAALRVLEKEEEKFATAAEKRAANTLRITNEAAKAGWSDEQRDALIKKSNAAIKDQTAKTKEHSSALEAKLRIEQANLAAMQAGGLAYDKLSAGQKQLIELETKLKYAKTASEKAILQKDIATTREIIGVEKAIAAHKNMLGIAKAEQELFQKIEEAGEKNRQRLIDAAEKQIEAAEAAAKQAEFEAETYGLTESAILKLAASRKEDEAATLKASAAYQTGSEVAQKQAAALEAEAEALRRRAAARRNSEDQGVIEAQNKALVDASQKTADKISDNLSDALMRGFENGKGFAENLRDSTVAMFKTMILRPQIQAMVSGGLNALGMGGSAQNSDGGGSGGGDGLGTVLNAAKGFSNLANLGSNVSSFALSGAGQALGLSSSAVPAGYAAFSEVAATTLTASGSALTGAASAVSGAATSVAGAGTAVGGALSAVMAAAPYIAIAYAIYSIFKGKEGGPKSGGSARLDFDPTGRASDSLNTNRLFTPDQSDADVIKAVQATGAGFTAQLKALGGKGGATFGLGFDSDPRGTAQNRVHGEAFVNGQYVYNQGREIGRDNEKIGEELGLETQRMMIAALKASDLPAEIGQIIAEGIPEAKEATAEAIGKVLTDAQFWKQAFLDTPQQISKLFGETVRLDAFKGLQQSSETLTQTFARLQPVFAATNLVLETSGQSAEQAFGAAGLASEAARTQLVNFAGGADKLASAMGGYFQNFFSQEEQLKISSAGLAQAFAAIGQTMPSTRAGFRDLLESFDKTTESGRKAYAQVVELAPAFANLVPDPAPALEFMRGIRNSLAALGQTGTEQQLASLDQGIADHLTRLRELRADTTENIALVQQLGAAQKTQVLADAVGLGGDAIKSAFLSAINRDNAAGDAGKALADGVIGGLHSALQANLADQVQNLMLQGVVHPILSAMAKGATLSEAVAQVSFGATLTAAKKAISDMAELFKSQAFKDFTASLGSMLSDIGSFGSGVGQYVPSLPQPSSTPAETQTPAITQRQLDIALLNAQGLAHQALLETRKDELATLAPALRATQAQIHAAEDAAQTRQREIALLEASGEASAALAARREIELKALGASDAVLQRQIHVAEDASKTRNLEIRLLEAAGHSIEALAARRELELKGLSATDQALQQQIHTAEDARQTRRLEIELLDASGEASAALAARRTAELKALNATDQALQQQIYAQEDLARATHRASTGLDALARIYSASGQDGGNAGRNLALMRAQQTGASSFNTLARSLDISEQQLGDWLKSTGLSVEEVAVQYWHVLSDEQQQAVAGALSAKADIIAAHQAIYDAQLQRVSELKSALDALAGLGKAIDQDIAGILIDQGKLSQSAYLDSEIKASKLRLTDLYGNGANTQTLVAEAEVLRGLTMQRYQAEKTALTELRDYAKGLSDYVQGLMVGDKSPLNLKAKVGEAYAQYQTTLLLANAGDKAAQGKLTGKADAYLQLKQQYEGATVAYADAFNAVTRDLTAAGADTLSEAERQTRYLTQLAGNADATLLELRGLKSAVDWIQGDVGGQLQAATGSLASMATDLQALGVSLPDLLASLPTDIATALSRILGSTPRNETTAATGTTAAALVGSLSARSTQADIDAALTKAGAARISPETLAATWNAANPNSPVNANDLEAYAKRMGIPGYDVGTDYVPRDQLALIHQGEGVITAPDNARLSRFISASAPLLNNVTRRMVGNDNAELIAAINRMNQQMAILSHKIDQASDSPAPSSAPALREELAALGDAINTLSDNLALGAMR